MKILKIAVAATLAVAGVGLGSLMTIPRAAVNKADCPYGWYWDDQRQNCLPPGLPKDPPNGCLTGDGTHFNGTICVN
jgi:type IV secretory pathway protease TraF